MQKGNTPCPAWHMEMEKIYVLLKTDFKMGSLSTSSALPLPSTPLTTASLKVRNQLSVALYYWAESKFAFSLEYEKGTDKQRANPSPPSPCLHRGKANTVRVAYPSPLAPACSWSPVLGVDSVLCFVLKLNSPVLEDGPSNVPPVTSQVSLLGRRGQAGASQEFANQAEKLRIHQEIKGL